MSDVDTLARPSPLDRATNWLLSLAGVGLMFMVVVIAFGVIARYVLGSPILGLNEIIQLTAVVLVMAALPYCTAHDGHVAVDVFDRAIGRWGRFAGDLFTRVATGFVLALLVRRAVFKALDAWEFEDTTNMLRLPIWPFYGILAIGMGICVLIFAAQVFQLLKRGAE